MEIASYINLDTSRHINFIILKWWNDNDQVDMLTYLMGHFENPAACDALIN